MLEPLQLEINTIEFMDAIENCTEWTKSGLIAVPQLREEDQNIPAAWIGK